MNRLAEVNTPVGAEARHPPHDAAPERQGGTVNRVCAVRVNGLVVQGYDIDAGGEWRPRVLGQDDSGLFPILGIGCQQKRIGKAVADDVLDDRAICTHKSDVIPNADTYRRSIAVGAGDALGHDASLENVVMFCVATRASRVTGAGLNAGPIRQDPGVLRRLYGEWLVGWRVGCPSRYLVLLAA
jgi:hypothetical protein